MARSSYNPGPAGAAIPRETRKATYDREQLVPRIIATARGTLVQVRWPVVAPTRPQTKSALPRP